ncbi:MAG: hypothetical protein JWP49_440 [Phenylobacterium sp.]|jgi:hypothetical protein|nr:hypothetical protein [Phenylobacterium sp.]
MTPIQGLCAAVIATAAISVAAPAQAERWVPVPGNFAEGTEICVDADSIHRGPDGKTDYLQKICWFDSGLLMRVDCAQKLTGETLAFDVKAGSHPYEREVVSGQASAAFGIRWACGHRK